jgi:hypothetical protein
LDNKFNIVPVFLGININVGSFVRKFDGIAQEVAKGVKKALIITKDKPQIL